MKYDKEWHCRPRAAQQLGTAILSGSYLHQVDLAGEPMTWTIRGGWTVKRGDGKALTAADYLKAR